MTNQLSNLDEILLKIRNRISKEYLREALTSYRAGAYRASVISTWIAIYVDLIEKVKELSVSNDAVAKKIEKRLDSIQSHDIRGKLDFENDILSIAQEELGIISPIEKIHLERIKQDRNVCAHPTFSNDGIQFVPNPEMARSYIVQAANYLLIQMPIKGKVHTDKIFELICDESFPEDKEKAFEILKSDQYLGRVKESVIRNLVIILFKRLFIDDKSISLSLMKKITSALAALGRINSEELIGVCNTKLKNILATSNANGIRRLVPFLNYLPELWRYIEDAIKLRLEQLIKSMNVSELIKYHVAVTADSIPEIDVYLKSSIQDMTDESLKRLLKESPSSVLREKAINVFVESWSFASAYKNGVEILLKYSAYLTDCDLQKIFEGTKKNGNSNINQILNAGGISEFFAMLYTQTQNKNVIEHSNIWVAFRDEILELGFQFSDLDSFMAVDGIIEIDNNEVVEEELV